MVRFWVYFKGHMAISLYLCDFTWQSSYEEASHIELKAHPAPLLPHFTLTNYICNNPIFKKGNILRHEDWTIFLEGEGPNLTDNNYKYVTFESKTFKHWY